MTAKELGKEQKVLKELIDKTADKLGDSDKKPIYDGIADIKGYLKTSPKIMWLLKEAYGEKDPITGQISGGDWSLADDIYWDNFWKSSSMWQHMIKINYAIHHNYITRDKIPPINEVIANELKKAAYININKMPGDKTSTHAHLKRCYKNWRDIIIKQIKLYKPDIIIFGYTFQFFNEDPFFDGYSPLRTFGEKWVAGANKKNTIVLIDAYHPARKGDGKDYVDNIIKAVKYAMQNK